MTILYKVSVIIPTYRRCDSVKRVLQALSSQTVPSDEYEVIISIDGSEDGTREVVDTFKPDYTLRSIWSPNSGRASACNKGIREARGEIIILLDDDMEPTKNFIRAHYNAHIRGARVGVIGAAPIPINESSSFIVHYIAEKFNSHMNKISTPGYNFQIRDFYSGNFSIRRKLFLEVGLYNEAFKTYGNEDVELASRFLKSGVKLAFNSEALALQYYEKDFSGVAIDNIDKGKTAVLLVSLHPETFNDLKLTKYNHESWKWRSIRAALIKLSILFPKTKSLIILFSSFIEKLHPTYLNTYYFLSLDYFFWLGVQTALKETTISNRDNIIQHINDYKKS